MRLATRALRPPARRFRGGEAASAEEGGPSGPSDDCGDSTAEEGGPSGPSDDCGDSTAEEGGPSGPSDDCGEIIA